MNKKTGISVIIPNYNGKTLLVEILPCLYIALNNSGQEFEVIIVDDYSTDDSVNFLQQEYPSIHVLQNEINKGFSPTVNKGILFSRYDYVLILNSDVKLTENYFKNLFRYFDREDTFGVMGRIIGWEDDQIQDGAKYPSFHGAKIKTAGNYYAKEPHESDRLYSMYLSGANAFIAKDKLLVLGGFDELFAPFYVEDYELSLRAWRLGWKCYYDHYSVCRHKTSVTIKSKSKKTFVNTIYDRNKMFLHAIHLPGQQKTLWYLQLIVETLIRIFTLRFYYLNALKMFFNSRKKVKQSRNRFLELCNQSKHPLQVRDVINLITDSLKNKTIIRF